MPVWLALGVLNVTSSGCCCGVWTEEFWSDKNERQQFFRDLSIVQLDGSGDEHLRSQQFEFRKRLESGKCPYGFTLPMDVTWPSVPESGKIVEPMTVLKSLAVVYGYLPLVPVTTVLAISALRRSTRHLWILLWLLFLLVVNEGIVKKIVAEPRPGSMLELRGQNGLLEGSCVETCGMPSSHSAISMGWFTLSVLDAISRTDTSRDLDDAGDALVVEQRKWTNFLKKFCWIPWAEKTDLTVREFISVVIYWCLLLVPVPFMRVVLRDHTESQVFVGSAIGMVLAMVWWRVLRVLEMRWHMNLRGHPERLNRPPSELEMGTSMAG